MSGQIITSLTNEAAAESAFPPGTGNAAGQTEESIVKADALQRAIFNSANFSSIATDAKGVIQISNVGAERMLGYKAAEVMNTITPADISDPQELIARAQALSAELDTPITPGFEALVFKASRGIEDIYELTYIRKDGTRFPAVVSVTALRDAAGTIIGTAAALVVRAQAIEVANERVPSIGRRADIESFAHRFRNIARIEGGAGASANLRVCQRLAIEIGGDGVGAEQGASAASGAVFAARLS